MKFLEKVTHASSKDAQLIMAKTTGNFKRGNERRYILFLSEVSF
ncbi:ABC transporter ATP-binding protein [Candidatus Thorarchaeota archaeon]|nr:MAG: ABC transporter ATP-binding protein [Candidatus Thorarchaeota archaeon]